MSSNKLTEISAIGIYDYDKYPEVKSFTYKPQEQRPNDIDVKIDACAICGSDVHAARGDWMKPYAPLAVGHEIIGHVVSVGPAVTKFKIGQRVGIGPLVDCCNSCARCEAHHNNNCRKSVLTYLGTYAETGVHTQGGYASHIRVSSQFAFKIPDSLDTIHAAPLLCGGITGFSPLLLTGVTKGTKVGVCGIGGIGHMTVLFAKALGAEVTAISRNDKKREISAKLGADHYISTSEEGFLEKYSDSLDVIIHTASSFSENAISTVIELLKPNGRLQFITGPPISEKVEILPLQMIMGNYNVGGTASGSIEDMEYMLEFAAEHNIKPWVETIDINEENVTKAWERMDKGDVKFRFVLTGYDKFFT